MFAFSKLCSLYLHYCFLTFTRSFSFNAGVIFNPNGARTCFSQLSLSFGKGLLLGELAPCT